MRVCMLMSTTLPPREGIGFYVWNLAQSLTCDGHEIQIITRGSLRFTSCEKVDGITIWRPPFLPVYPYHVHMHGLMARRLIAQIEPEVDLFHLHTPLVPWPKTNRPTLITVHTSMKADAASIPTTSLIGRLVKLQLPVSYHLERTQFRRAGRLAAVAHSVASELADYGIDPTQVAVLGNGVDTIRFFPDSAGPDLTAPYVLTAGRLGPRKGLEDLIRCAQMIIPSYPHLRFLIAGSGPFEQEIRTTIRKRGLQNHIILLGHISDRERMRELYRRAIVYVHPAHYEGLATVLIEAMACGCPTIATAVSGALDVIVHEQNGLLVAPRAPHELAAAIKRLLTDSDMACRLGTAAHQTVSKHYSWQIITQHYLTHYQLLLKGA